MNLENSTGDQQHRQATISFYRRAVTRVIAHVKADLGGNHTLNDLAEVASLSPFHFSRIFREVAGISPVRYIYALRIAEAERLLLTTRLKVIDICYAVGYNSLGSFNNRFVSLVGHSPRRIRILSTSIDLLALRRTIKARANKRELQLVEPCSLRGRIYAPDAFSGVLLVALFRGPPSNSYPIACAIAEQQAYVLPPILRADNYFVMAVGFIWHESMVEFLLQPRCLRATLPPIPIAASGLRNPINFILETGQSIDPPIPPSLAFHLVNQAVQLPDELADGGHQVGLSAPKHKPKLSIVTGERRKWQPQWL